MAHLHEVFGIAQSVNMASYVDRGALDQRLEYLLGTGRHVAIHGDSKQGKTWLRSHLLPTDRSILVQCTLDSTPESILTTALGQLGVSAELHRTESNELEGHLDLAIKGGIGAKILAKVGAEMSGGGSASHSGEVETEPVGQAPGDLAWVARILLASEMRLVVEDFHYLAETHQRSFAYMLKALGEYGVYPIIVGIWPQDHLLTYFNGDLDGRVEDLHLVWSDEELAAVLRKGGDALSITFSENLSRDLVRDAYGNVGLLQRLAENVCLRAGVHETLVAGRSLDADSSLEDARTDVAASMSGRFQAFADNFVQGMRRMPQGLEVYRHLLQTVTEAPDQDLLAGIDSAALLAEIAKHEGDAQIRASDLTQALDRIDRLQAKIQINPPVLSYNRVGRRVFLGDKSFLFFRHYGDPKWPWAMGETLTNDLAAQQPLDFGDF